MLMAETTVTTTHWHGVDPAFALEFSQRLIVAWNAHQADQLLELMTDDVVYDDASWPARMHGQAAVRGFLESTWRAVPDLSLELIEGPLVDPAAPQDRRLLARASAPRPAPGIRPACHPTARRISFEGATVEDFRDGKSAGCAWSMTLPTSCASLASCPGRGCLGERASSRCQTCRRSCAGAEHSPANPLLSLDGGSEALDGALEPLAGLARDRPQAVGCRPAAGPTSAPSQPRRSSLRSDGRPRCTAAARRGPARPEGREARAWGCRHHGSGKARSPPRALPAAWLARRSRSTRRTLPFAARP